MSRRGAHRLRRGRPTDPARSGTHLLLHALVLGATLAAAVVLVHAGGTWARFSDQRTSAPVRVVGWSAHPRDLAATTSAAAPAVSSTSARTPRTRAGSATGTADPTSPRPTSSVAVPTLTPSPAALVRTGG